MKDMRFIFHFFLSMRQQFFLEFLTKQKFIFDTWTVCQSPEIFRLFFVCDFEFSTANEHAFYRRWKLDLRRTFAKLYMNCCRSIVSRSLSSHKSCFPSIEVSFNRLFSIFSICNLREVHENEFISLLLSAVKCNCIELTFIVVQCNQLPRIASRPEKAWIFNRNLWLYQYFPF